MNHYVTVFRIEHLQIEKKVGGRRKKRVYCGPFQFNTDIINRDEFPGARRFEKYSHYDLRAGSMPAPYSDTVVADRKGRMNRNLRGQYEGDGCRDYGGQTTDRLPNDWWLCGVPTWDHIVSWFGMDAGYLKRFGYVVRQYQVPRTHIIVLRHQVTFDCRKARLLRTIPLRRVKDLRTIPETPVSEHTEVHYYHD